MLSHNLRILRHRMGLTQEELAEKMHITRQTVAKWETGISLPDITACVRLADLFQISLEDLVRDQSEESLIHLAPRGKFVFGTVRVGEDGGITLPEEARKIFDLKPGTRLVLLGDREQGLALIPAAWWREMHRLCGDLEEGK